MPTAARPGHVTSEVHPQDPLQAIWVAGFATLPDALRYVTAGFVDTAAEPVVTAQLSRGDTTSFAGAEYLVFFHRPGGAPALLSVARCHSDLHLVVGSCGYQLLLTVNTTPPASEPGLLR
jgi:hypothetical protein